MKTSASRPRPKITTLPLTVVYGQVDGQVEAGKYDQRDKRITSSNFPTNKTGTVRLDDAKFVHFGICMTSDMVVEAFAKLRLRLRPGDADEILAVGVEYPDMQKGGPVVALGSVLLPEIKSPVQPDPYRRVIVLWEERGRRILSLNDWGGIWRADCRFIGFPIKPSK